MRIFILLLLLLGSIFFESRLFGQTEAQIQTEANALFDQEKYVEATPLYLRLLSLQPRNSSYNYKYGTCLLYSSENKSSAFKYLNYAVSTGNVADEAYFFLGKAYHLTFQFNKAIANYSKYEQLAGAKQSIKFQVSRQIEMCQNGKLLLSNVTDLIVLSKKEVDYNGFYKLYDLSNIGGTLIVTEKFQSKQDKKKKHFPLIHYPSNPTRIYYSSFGDKGSNQKDIYTRTRLPDNSWSEPQPVLGLVNTAFDEDYPYMHPNGDYLYFSSKGHNSMGGFDIFRAKYNSETNSFGALENMDYAISSPSDDLFYIVDSFNKYAYFASHRDSEEGKINVYEVRVERYPVQMVVIKGTFKSEINPENTSLDIDVYNASTNQIIGKFKTDEKGEYLIILPKGGEYEFVVQTKTSENQFKQTIDVPFLKDFKPLKQKIEEDLVEENQTVKITNLFTEEFEDPSAVMAEVIQKKAQLLPNSEEYDLDALDSQKQANDLLSQIGLEGFTALELKDLIDSKVYSLSQKEENLKVAIVQNNNKKTRLSTELNETYAELQTKLRDIENLSGNDQKLEKQNELILQTEKIEEKLNQLKATEVIEEELSVLLIETQKDVLFAEELKEAYNSAPEKEKHLVFEDYEKFVEESILKSEPVEVISFLPIALDEELEASKELSEEIKQIETKIEANTKEIEDLELKAIDAKKKPRESLTIEINIKKEELELFKDELAYFENEQEKYRKTELLKLAKKEIKTLNEEQTLPLEKVEVEIGLDKLVVDKIKKEVESEKLKINAIVTTEDTLTDKPISSDSVLINLEELKRPVLTNSELNAVLPKEYKAALKSKSDSYEKNLISRENYLEFVDETVSLNSKIRTDLEQEKTVTLSEIKGLSEKSTLTIEQKSQLVELTKKLAELTQKISFVANEQEQLRVLAERLKLEKAEEEKIDESKSEETVELIKTELETTFSPIYRTKQNDKRKAYQSGVISRDDYLNFIEQTIVENEKIQSDIEQEKTVTLWEIKGLSEKSTLTIEQKSELIELTKKEAELTQNISFVANEQEQLRVLAERLKLEIAEGEKIEGKKRDTSEISALEDTQNRTELKSEKIVQLLDEEKELKVLYTEGEISTPDFIALKRELITALIDEIQLEKENETVDANLEQQTQKEVARIKIEIENLERVYEEKKEENKNKSKIYVDSLLQENTTFLNVFEVTIEDKSIEELLEITQEIEEMIAVLSEEINKTKNRLAIDFATEINKQLVTEINNLNKKKQTVQIEIGTLESIANFETKITSSANEKAQNKLKKIQRDYHTEKLKVEQLNTDEQATGKALEKLVKLENEVLQQQVEFVQNNASEALTSYKSEVRKKELENKIVELDGIKDIQTRNEKLKEIQQAQIQLEEIRSEQKRADQKASLIKALSDDFESELLKETNGLLSTSQIEEKNANLALSRIEIDRKIENLKEQSNSSDLEDLPTNQIEYLEILENAKSEILLEIEENEQVLQERAKRVMLDNFRGVESSALETNISFEKELQLASEEVYKALRNSMNTLDQLKYEINIKRKEIEQKRSILNDLISTQTENGSEEGVFALEKLLNEVILLENELKVLRNALSEGQKSVTNRIAALSKNKNEFENLLIRDVAPTLNKENISRNSEENRLGLEISTSTKPVKRKTEISLENNIPEGIVFRVQIGAFSKPVDKNTFAEFNPLSGEQVRPGLIRYMAGVFASKQDARKAQVSVRKLGYSDAFVVAYCDRERIPIYRAEQLLASGACVSKIKPIDAVLVENGKPITQTTAVDIKEELSVDAFSYNKSDNSAPAEAVESKNGLFFTVQVGVYNRPVTVEQLYNISPLVTLRLPNGQIRYSTGMYNSVDEARPKLDDAIDRGVSDAFITAYYKGDRVGVSKASRLLTEFGDTILESKQFKKGQSLEQINSKEHLPEVSTPFVQEKEQEIKLISTEQYDNYPTQVLNRYNETGVRFYYNSVSKRVASGLLDPIEQDKVLLIKDEFESIYYYNGERVINNSAINRENAVQTEQKYVLNVRILGNRIDAAFAEVILALELPWEITQVEDYLTLEIGASTSEEVLLGVKQNLLQFNVAEMTISALKSNDF